MNYTKKQLIAAQLKYNKNFVSTPEIFAGSIENTKEYAKEQIEYLLELVD